MQPEQDIEIEDIAWLCLTSSAQSADLLLDHGDRTVPIHPRGASAQSASDLGVKLAQRVVIRPVTASGELYFGGGVTRSCADGQLPASGRFRLFRPVRIDDLETALAQQLGEGPRIENLVYAIGERIDSLTPVVEIDVARATIAPKEEAHVRPTLQDERCDR